MAYISFQPKDHFNTKIYTGNGANNHAITGVGFAPDFTWIKARANAYDHMLFDSLRGTASLRENLRTNSTDASDNDASNMKTLDSDGFTLNLGGYVNNSVTFASWNWKANGQGSANTSGSINTTYTSANTTSGMSIIKYGGNGSAGATIGHGLGVAPKCVIIKRTDTTSNWIFGNGATGFDKFFYLNASDAITDNAGTFNDTAPSSTLITLGSWNDVNNSSGTYIAYAFAEKQGFSKFGEYLGNGNANGTFVYTGFKPAFVMIKRRDAGDNWNIFDNKRVGYNWSNYRLFANSSAVEETAESAQRIDILSNGFKLRDNETDANGNNNPYVYIAFAEAPLVGSNGLPCTAR